MAKAQLGNLSTQNEVLLLAIVLFDCKNSSQLLELLDSEFRETLSPHLDTLISRSQPRSKLNLVHRFKLLLQKDPYSFFADIEASCLIAKLAVENVVIQELIVSVLPSPLRSHIAKELGLKNMPTLATGQSAKALAVFSQLFHPTRIDEKQVTTSNTIEPRCEGLAEIH